MDDAMVTGRMPQSKKNLGAEILKTNGLNASQAINLLYDRIIKEGNASFLTDENATSEEDAWKNAVRFVDSLSSPKQSRFDSMSKAEIRMERLRKHGLLDG